MGALETIQQRHSVRQYRDQPIPESMRRELLAEVARINAASGLSVQLLFDEPSCFEAAIARYGSFSGVVNYIALVGSKGPDLDEACGYWGEQLVLRAQELGLNTCWVGLNYGKTAAVVGPGQKLVCVIALGFGANQGKAHKVKPREKLTDVPLLAGSQEAAAPEWFVQGLRAAQLAPTAINQQKFLFSLVDGEPVARVKGVGPYVKVDLGIVKWHFEAVTGRRVG